MTADTTAIAFQRVYEIYATNSGWVENTDYTIDYQVVGADGMNRKAEMGTSTSWGTTHTSGIFVEGDTVKATFTPMGDKAGKFNPLTITKSSADTVSPRRLPAPPSAWVGSAATGSISLKSPCPWRR